MEYKSTLNMSKSGFPMRAGLPKREPEYVQEILDGKDRKLAGPTAPPEGLCLMKVDY